MHLRGPFASGAKPLSHTLDTVERFVERARERGVDEIAFTEHVYYFAQTREVWALPYQLERCTFDLDAYCDVILEAKRRGLPVKLGLELDYVGERQERLSELVGGYPWDILLGFGPLARQAIGRRQPGSRGRRLGERFDRRCVARVLRSAWRACEC